VNRTLKPAQLRKGLDQLVGKPLAVAATPHDPLAELLLLERRARELEAGTLCQRSFTEFRLRCCWTRNEAAGGTTELIPDYPYLREVDDLLVTRSPLMLAKARRMLGTWEVLAFDLWLIGGGQDPRWQHIHPQTGEIIRPLMRSTENRKVIIAARKLEDENGSADFLSRARFMYDQFEKRGGREHWPDFPTIKWSYSRAEASNGSLLVSVPQGKDQLAGSGATHVHLEEFSRWTEQKASLASALQTLQGGGHLTMVCTAQAETHAARIALDQIERLV
jgi:hypothetical protein